MCLHDTSMYQLLPGRVFLSGIRQPPPGLLAMLAGPVIFVLNSLHQCAIQQQIRSNCHSWEKVLLKIANRQGREFHIMPFLVYSVAVQVFTLHKSTGTSPRTWAFSLIESLVDLCLNFNIPRGWPKPLQYPYWTSSSGAFFVFKTGPTKRKFRLWDTVLSSLIRFHKPFFSLPLCNQRVTLQLLFGRAKY